MEEIKEAGGINIGDYIRDETGEIFRIADKELEEEIDEIYWYRGDGICNGCYSNQVVKHSPNIIDLIEVGDYVNGYKVTRIYEDIEKFVQCDYPVKAGSTNHYKFYNMAIKSICTREQFENIEYKVEE